MSGVLLLTATFGLVCQRGPDPVVEAPRTARWIEAGGVIEGEWRGWSASGPKRAEAPLRGPWLALEFEVRPQPADPEAWALSLAGGIRLRGTPGPDLPDAGMPTWRLALGGAAPLPLDPLWLRSLGRGLPPAADPAAEEDWLWLQRPGGVLDLHRGFLLDWRAAGPVFETAAGERTVPWEEIHALRLLDEPSELRADDVWLFLADGSALAARVLAQDPREADGEWQIELPWGARARLPGTAVSRVRRRDGVEEWGRTAWEVREQPRGEVLDWSPKVGLSVEGRELRLGGRSWPDGIGVKAPAELARAAPGPGTLLLTVGADDRVAEYLQPQPLVFRVLLDGEELARTAPLGVEDGPRTLLVEVPRAGLLRLRAEGAGIGEQGAHGDWCDLLWLPSRGGEATPGGGASEGG